MAGLPAYQTPSTICKLKEEGYNKVNQGILQRDQLGLPSYILDIIKNPSSLKDVVKIPLSVWNLLGEVEHGYSLVDLAKDPTLGEGIKWFAEVRDTFNQLHQSVPGQEMSSPQFATYLWKRAWEIACQQVLKDTIKSADQWTILYNNPPFLSTLLPLLSR